MNQLILTLIACLLSAWPAHATLLTFDIDGAADRDPIPQAYGDGVTAIDMGAFHYGADGGFTPNVSISYASATGGDLNFWSDNFNDLTNVIHNDADPQDGFTITFTADPGFYVMLESLDMGNWTEAMTVPGMDVQDGGGATLASYSSILLPKWDTQSHVSFSPGVQGETLILHVDTTGLGGNSDNVGLDNILFSQVAVPEPASLLLTTSALFGLVLLRRGRRG